MNKKIHHNLEIDILRFCFSIVVVFHHWSFHGFTAGYLAVEFFFIVSGYFFTNSIITKHLSGGGYFEKHKKYITLPFCRNYTCSLLEFYFQQMDN